ncbi:IBR domain-containing protein, partial [Klebsiella pneumoniae]
IEPFSIKCSICFTKKEDFHNLGCKDNFCKSCISLLLENYILSSYVFPDEILCPICSASIPDKLVLKLSSEDIYNKMLELREKLKVQKLIAQNKAMHCPLPNCEGFGHLIPDEKITACNKCKCSICTACKKAVHPGITCEEAAANSEDSQIEDLLLSQNWKKCPTCGVPVEKIDGCQFVTCTSPLCKGSNALCYLCGRFLIEAQHFNHYKTKGPFGDTCNTFEGIE